MKTRLTSVCYLGYTAMDRRFSNSMLPWLLKEIRRMGINDKLSIAVEDGFLKAYNGNFEPVLIHRLVDIIRACQVPGHPEELIYLLLNEKEGLLNCYLFQASTEAEVTDLFNQMRESSPTPSPRGSTSSLQNAVTKNSGFQTLNSSEHLPWATPSISLPKNCNTNLSNESNASLEKSPSNASALTSLCADLSLAESHFFEVLYIGKVRISQRKVPDSLIDDALTKFAKHEAEKVKINQLRRNSLLSSQSALFSTKPSTDNLYDNEKAESTTSKEISFKKTIPASTSTTPLEPDKRFSWKSIDNIAKDIECKRGIANTPTTEIEDEFDLFSKQRIERKINSPINKPNQIPLEPTVLILNVACKNNLTTLKEDEEKQEELNVLLTNTASSITEFCQNNFLKDASPSTDDKKLESESGKTREYNPFSDWKSEEIDSSLKTCDPLSIRIANERIENLNAVATLKKEKNTREDSPAPNMDFHEIDRKPKMLVRSKSGIDHGDIKKISMPENRPFLRDRSASIGTISMKTPIAQLIGEQNRTMLFQVGRSELRLISTDRKQILLHRAFKDVASCVLGKLQKDHFGFVCRETGNDSYACYVFKCESECVAYEIVSAIKQAFVAHAECLKKARDKPANMTCEHCPVLWYHRLCHDIEGMNDKKMHAFILRRVEQLTQDEQEQIITKYQGGTNHMYEVSEHNSFLMMLLRAHCEVKQQRHVHDTAEHRSEFLNHYLGGSTIFMKAKKSLSSGFDHLLKRRGSRDDGNGIGIKKEPSPISLLDTPPDSPAAATHLIPDMATRSKSQSPALDKNTESPSIISTEDIVCDDDRAAVSANNSSTSPMMDIFLKVNDSRSESSDESKPRGDETWRQAIYQKVMQPSDAQGDELSPKNLLGLQQSDMVPGKRSKYQLRQLWKMAINQTVLLVRMERENAKLKESEKYSAVRRIKLEYTDMGVVDAGVTLTWDSMMSNRNRPISKIDHHMLTQAVIQGVPRTNRGSIWYFLAEQACLRSPPPDPKKYPNYNTPYYTLLAGLTKHQHAILIDLGRTFPQHSYFSSSLGPGQLALYNILKAYSLLDPEVGYCQGLSFVAGTLLLHMDEAEAFILLRHLMFRRGLRKQYLPDMSALQVQLYQMSRLLRDHEPELHSKLEALDISPAMYAAPWMLTLFTSQFPLGFVVRVFDIIFLESLDIVFSVALALLSAHREGLMMCDSCEEAADYLKLKLPDVTRPVYEKVMRNIFSLDISRQLADYAVEYGVLREEMPRVSSLTALNRKLSKENAKMSNQLDAAMEAITNYQNAQNRLDNHVKVMEVQLGTMSKFLVAHHKQDLPGDLKKITQAYTKKISFGSKFASKFASNDEEQDKAPLTGLSTPNLFSKVTKEDLHTAASRDKPKVSPEMDKRANYIMKKSHSIHTGLVSNSVKQYPLKALEETTENEYRSGKRELSIESLRDMTFKKSVSTEEQIQQERMYEKQLKHHFDENLKRLDAKLSTNRSYIDDVDAFKTKKSLSLNLHKQTDDGVRSLGDSGFVTPFTPSDGGRTNESSVVSHPLSGCDVDIKFDGRSTKLKQLGPVFKLRTPSVDSSDFKNS